MNSSIIYRVRATPVSVPAKPDSINSPGVDETDAKFAKKFQTGGLWSEFHLQTKWIIELFTENDLSGIGETYRSVTKEDVQQAMSHILGKDVMQLNWRNLPVDNPRVYDAIESAVMDLAGKMMQAPVFQLLGGAFRDRIECNGWTGRRSPQDAARKAYEAMQRGHTVFKFKCADNDNVGAWAQEIKNRCGSKIKILLDPNQRWHDVETTLRLMEGVPLDMMYGLEDPVDRQDYVGFRTLREKLKIPLFVHIALPYRHMGQKKQDLITAMRERCADGFNINGPMFDFISLAETAAIEGLPCWHGSEVDLGILEASALHAIAASSLSTIPADIFGELVRQDDLIKQGIVFEKGKALIPQGHGLGVELDHQALAKFKIGEIWEAKK